MFKELLECGMAMLVLLAPAFDDEERTGVIGGKEIRATAVSADSDWRMVTFPVSPPAVKLSWCSVSSRSKTNCSYTELQEVFLVRGAVIPKSHRCFVSLETG